MKVGETTRLDVQQLAHTHRFFLGKASPFQQNEWQTYSFFYESYDSESHLVRWIRLWRLHLWTFQLAPIECNFSATLDVNRDTLDRVTMSMTSGIMPHTFTLTVTDEAPEISPVAGSYVVDDARPQYFVIYLKPNATRSQREIAYSFNLKCLDKIGGCRDKYELLMGSAIPNQQAADGSGKGCDENCTNGLKSMQWAGPEFPSRKSKYFSVPGKSPNRKLEIHLYDKRVNRALRIAGTNFKSPVSNKDADQTLPVLPPMVWCVAGSQRKIQGRVNLNS